MGERVGEDYISIQNLRVFGYHGVLEEEKRNGQEFLVSARLYYDMAFACESDSLPDALDYADCCFFIRDEFREKRFDLIEAAADDLCRELLLRYGPLLRRVDLELGKPHAPVGLPFTGLSVNLSRGWHRVCLSVGSNMGDRNKMIDQAEKCLTDCPEIQMLGKSDLIETEPYGYTEQDKFLNGTYIIDTIYSPHRLLAFLHEIEASLGRKRDIRWGPRTIDLDILFYDDLILEDEELVIPHVDMENRRFVLEPLAQLVPYKRHPVLGRTVAQLRNELIEGQTDEQRR